jgi:hypothetical protein
MLDNPPTKAQAGTGSGLLSPDNDDRTARNLREAYESHNIAWKDVVHWNAVPFPVANSDGGSTRGEQREGARRIIEFVRRCPNLKMVSCSSATQPDTVGHLPVWPSQCRWLHGKSHYSDKGLNSAPDARDRLDKVIVHLARAINEG